MLPKRHAVLKMDKQQARAALRRIVLETSKQDKQGQIPRLLVQYWDQVPPCDVDALMQTVRQWCRGNGVAYRLFDDQGARAFLSENYGDVSDEVNAYDAAFHPAMKSDLFRLCYIALNGGFYLDADQGIDCVPADLFSVANQVFFFKEDTSAVPNGFFGADAGCATIIAARDLAVANTLASDGKGDDIAQLTGPIVLTRGIAAGWPTDSQTKTATFYSSELAFRFFPHAQSIIGKALDYKGTALNWGLFGVEDQVKSQTEDFNKKKTVKSFFRLLDLHLKRAKDTEAASRLIDTNSGFLKSHGILDRALMTLLVAKGDFDGAYQAALRAYDNGDRSVAILRELAQQMKDRAVTQKTVSFAFRFRARHPDQVHSHILLLKVLLHFGDHDLLDEAVVRARRKFPLNAQLAELEALHIARKPPKDDAGRNSLLADWSDQKGQILLPTMPIWLMDTLRIDAPVHLPLKAYLEVIKLLKKGNQIQRAEWLVKRLTLSLGPIQVLEKRRVKLASVIKAHGLQEWKTGEAYLHGR